MGAFFDVGLCVILLIFVICGFKRGFVRSLIELVGSIVSVVASVMLSQRAAELIHPYLKNFIKQEPKLMTVSTLERAVAIVLLFIIIEILIHILANILDRLFRLPVLRQINALLGGAFGLLKGGVVVLLICAVLQLFAPTATEKSNLISSENWQKISNSNIYSHIQKHNPVQSLFKTDIWNEVGKNESKK